MPQSATIWPERAATALKAAPPGAPDAAGAPGGQATAAAEAAVATVRVPAAAMTISLFCFRLVIR